MRGKTHETNTGGKATMPDNYKCTITCSFCGHCKDYEDECYHKQHLSAKLKGEGGGQNSKGNRNKGKGNPKGRGKGQEQGKGARGGPNKHSEENQDTSRANPSPTPGAAIPEPSGGQQNAGPRTRGQTQPEKEQGAKRGQEDGHNLHPR